MLTDPAFTVPGGEIKRMPSSATVEVGKLLFKYAVNYRGARGEHGRRLFFRLARRFTPWVVSDIGSARYAVSTRDDGIGNEVFLRGSFDLEQQDAAYRCLHQLGYGDFSGKCFVDVGANIGTNCVEAVLRRHFQRAVALEPDPATLRLLRVNLLLNGLDERIVALQTALSDERGAGTLLLNPESPGTQALQSEGSVDVINRNLAPGTETISVPIRTFDELVAEGVIPLEQTGLVWIDTQAHEAHVLRGAQTLLASSAPVIIEYTPDDLVENQQLDALHELVSQHYTHVVDIRANLSGNPVLIPSAKLPELQERYARGAFTDLLLLKR